MNEPLTKFERIVHRVFREELNAEMSRPTESTYRYYINLPEIYESIYDLKFTSASWEKKIKEIDDFLWKAKRIKKWIEDDFEWMEQEDPPIRFRVALNVSQMRKKLYRIYENYLGIERKRHKEQDFFVLTLDVDVERFFSITDKPENYQWLAYENLLLEHFRADNPEKGKAFTCQTKKVEKGKKTFAELMDKMIDLLTCTRERYVRYVEFLKQPIADYSQINKPVIVKGGVSREKMFERWEREVKDTFGKLFILVNRKNGIVAMLPDESDLEQEEKIMTMLDSVKRIKKLIDQVGSDVKFYLGGGSITIDTHRLLIVYVPAFYCFSREGDAREMPFTAMLKAEGGKEDFMKYLSGWEDFLKGFLLSAKMKKRQRKEKRLMI